MGTKFGPQNRQLVEMASELWRFPVVGTGVDPVTSRFSGRALPTELPDRVTKFGTAGAGRSLVADLTGFEPATSALTGRRALRAAPQVRGDGSDVLPGRGYASR